MVNLSNKFAALCGDKILQRVFRGGFWNGIGLLATKCLMFGATMLFARTLSKTEFGAWGYLYGMFLSLLLFVDGPWSSAVTKYVAEYRDTEKEKAGQLIALYLLMMLPLAGIIAVLAAVFPKQIAALINHEELYRPIAIFLLTLIPLGVLSILKGVINGLEEFKMCSLLFPVLTLIDVLVKCFGLFYGGFNGLVTATLAATCCQLAVGVLFCRFALKKHGLSLVFRNCFRMGRKLLTYTLPNLLYIAITCSGNLLVPSFFISVSGGTETLANYITMTQLQSVLSFLPLMIATPLLAILSNAFRETPDTAWKTFFRLSGLLFCFLTALGILFILTAKPLMGLYGEAYVKAAGMFQWFVPSMIFQIICPFFNQLWGALEKLWIMNLSRITWLLMYVGLGWFLREDGLFGLVFATLVSTFCWFLSHILALFYLNRHRAFKNVIEG